MIVAGAILVTGAMAALLIDFGDVLTAPHPALWRLAAFAALAALEMSVAADIARGLRPRAPLALGTALIFGAATRAIGFLVFDAPLDGAPGALGRLAIALLAFGTPFAAGYLRGRSPRAGFVALAFSLTVFAVPAAAAVLVDPRLLVRAWTLPFSAGLGLLVGGAIVAGFLASEERTAA